MRAENQRWTSERPASSTASPAMTSAIRTTVAGRAVEPVIR